MFNRAPNLRFNSVTHSPIKQASRDQLQARRKYYVRNLKNQQSPLVPIDLHLVVNAQKLGQLSRPRKKIPTDYSFINGSEAALWDSDVIDRAAAYASTKQTMQETSWRSTLQEEKKIENKKKEIKY